MKSGSIPLLLQRLDSYFWKGAWLWSNCLHHCSSPCLMPLSCCMLVLPARFTRVLPAWWVPPGEFGSGFGRVCCRMQPKVGFVHRALGVMLSRHVLLPTRKPPALCKLTFPFFLSLSSPWGWGCCLSHSLPPAPSMVQMEKLLELHVSSGLASQHGCVMVSLVMSYKATKQGMCFGGMGCGAANST